MHLNLKGATTSWYARLQDLIWISRLLVFGDVSRAIAYLCKICQPRKIWGFKCNNLGLRWQPRLVDVVLCLLMGILQLVTKQNLGNFGQNSDTRWIWRRNDGKNTSCGDSIQRILLINIIISRYSTQSTFQDMFTFYQYCLGDWDRIP